MMEKKQCYELELLTKKLIAQYARNDYDLWFDTLYRDCVFVASGEPQLFGAGNIIEHFTQHHSQSALQIVNDSYTAIALGANTYIVTGQYIVGSSLSSPYATVLCTIAYRYVGEQPKIAYQHMSYDYILGASQDPSVLQQLAAQPVVNHQSANHPSLANQPSYLLDATSRLYIREILIGKRVAKSIQIKSGHNVFCINPATIIYLQSNDHRTTLYCVDNVMDSSMSISQIATLLPKSFYQVRRGCIINTIFVTAIRRCEVELVFRTHISVPAPKYAVIKKELEALMKEN